MDKIQVQKSLCAASLLAMLSVGAPAMAENGSADGLTINNYISRTSHAPATRNIVHDGIFDTVNGEIEETTLENWTADTASSIMFDADLANNVSDSINLTGTASDTVKLMGINIYSDSQTKNSTLTLFKNGVSPDIDISNYIQYTNNHKYTVSKGNAGEIVLTRYNISDGFKDAVNDTTENRSFSATSNVGMTEAVGTMGGTNLNIFGNGWDFTYTTEMPNYTPIFSSSAAGQSLYIDGMRVLSLKNNNTLINMTDGTSVNIKNSYFGYTNGSFTFERTPVTITNTTFEHNSQVYGTVSNSAGALFVRGESKIVDSTFKDNYVRNGDAGSAYGGAVELIGSSNIFNTTFENNYASSPESAFGGAIYINGSFNGNVKIYDSKFTGNYVTAADTSGTGGAIHAGNGLYLYNTEFSGNSANKGGAIYGLLGPYINESVFSGNRAAQTGGALHLTSPDWGTSSHHIGNTTFSGNTANNGAAIYVENTNLTIGSSIFGGDTAEMGNIAAENGGAIYVQSGTVDIYDSLFKNNQAESGSAIYIESGTVNVQNSTFDSNSNQNNGTIYVNGSSGTLNLKNSVFSNNTSDFRSGISLIRGTALIENTIFSGNQSSQASAVDNNNGNLVVNNSIFENNTSELSTIGSGATSGKAYVKNSIFKNNYGKTAGAIRIYNDFTIIADGGKTEFTGNTDETGSIAIKNMDENGAEMGVLNLNASKSGLFIINDDIASTNNNNIYINSTKQLFDGTSAPTDGNIQMNGKFIGSNVILDGGSLTLGEYAQISDGYFENSSLTINNGTLNTANGAADTLELNDFTGNGGNAVIDLAGGDRTYDKFNVSGTASGNLAIGAINVASELDNTTSSPGKITMELFSPENAPVLTVGGNTYTNFHLYEFTPSSAAGALEVSQLDITQKFDSVLADANTAVQVFTLSGNLKNTSDQGLTLAGTSLTIDGKGFDWDGNGLPGLRLDNEQILQLDNIGYMDEDGNIINSIHGFNASENGGALNVIRNNIADINNSIFKDNSSTGNGGAIHSAASSESTGAHLYIKNSIFVNNATENTINIGSLGGAVAFGNYVDFLVKDSVFSGNTAGYAGALYSATGGKIINSVFTNNNASTYGGAIYSNRDLIYGSTFDKNTSGRHGGAIFNQGQANIYNSVFTGNKTLNTAGTANSAEGGAIYNTGYLTVSGADFTGNSAQYVLDLENPDNSIANYGGAIKTTTALAINNSTFTNNSASCGGAIATNANLAITNSTFSNQKTNVIFNPTAGVTIGVYDSIFSENTGNINTSSGGAIQMNANAVIYGSEFTNNTANGRGGAIFNNNSNKLTVLDSIFSENTTINTIPDPDRTFTNSGGAIHVNNAGASTNATLNIIGSEFKNNTSVAHGGAIYVENTDAVVIGSVFDNNTAGNVGSAITINSSNMTIMNSTFTNHNDVIEGAGSWIQDGVIANGNRTNFNGGNLHVNNSTFDSNNNNFALRNNAPNSVLTVNNSVFSNSYNEDSANGSAAAAITNNSHGLGSTA